MVGKDNPAPTPGRGERRFATNEFFIYFDGQSRFHREHYLSATSIPQFSDKEEYS